MLDVPGGRFSFIPCVEPYEHLIVTTDDYRARSNSDVGAQFSLRRFLRAEDEIAGSKPKRGGKNYKKQLASFNSPPQERDRTLSLGTLLASLALIWIASSMGRHWRPLSAGLGLYAFAGPFLGIDPWTLANLAWW
jgi:hypothetical protein